MGWQPGIRGTAHKLESGRRKIAGERGGGGTGAGGGSSKTSIRGMGRRRGGGRAGRESLVLYPGYVDQQSNMDRNTGKVYGNVGKGG